jgi:hypothetical protein
MVMTAFAMLIMLVMVMTASTFLIVLVMVMTTFAMLVMLVMVMTAFAMFVMLVVVMTAFAMLVMLMVVMIAFAMLIVLVMVMTALAMLVMLMVMMFAMAFLIVMVMLMLVLEMFHILCKCILLFHSGEDSLAVKLIPRSSNYNSTLIIFSDNVKRFLKLCFLCCLCMRENDAGCVLDLITKEFAKVLHIHLALICVNNCGEAVKLCLLAANGGGRLNNVGEFTYA